MKNFRTSLIIFALIFGSALTALPQEVSQPGTTMAPPKLDTGRFGDPTSTARAYQHFKLGTISEVNKEELVIDNTPYGTRQWFKVTPKTKFLHDGQEVGVDQLKAGEHVFIDVKSDKKSGDLVLLTVAWGVVGKNMKGQGAKK